MSVKIEPCGQQKRRGKYYCAYFVNDRLRFLEWKDGETAEENFEKAKKYFNKK